MTTMFFWGVPKMLIFDILGTPQKNKVVAGRRGRRPLQKNPGIAEIFLFFYSSVLFFYFAFILFL